MENKNWTLREAHESKLMLGWFASISRMITQPAFHITILKGDNEFSG